MLVIAPSPSLLGTKLLISFGTFVICFASGAAPLKLVTIDDNAFSVGNMVAAGVLFAAGLVHQLPDSADMLEGKALRFGVPSDFPLASFVAGLTFMFFFMVEECIHTQFDNVINDSSDDHSNSNCPSAPLEGTVKDGDDVTKPRKGCCAGEKVNDHAAIAGNVDHYDERSGLLAHDKLSMNVKDQRGGACSSDVVAACAISGDGTECADEACRQRCRVFLCSSSVNCDDAGCRNKTNCSSRPSRSISIGSHYSDMEGNADTQKNDGYYGNSSSHTHSMHELKTRKQKQQLRRPSSRGSASDALESMRDHHFSHEHPRHYQEEHLADHAQTSLLSAMLLLVALSFHSFVEQLAIGVAATAAELTSTSAAVLAHKAFAGYALGSTLAASNMKRHRAILLVFVFSSCSIVGVFLGILLQSAIAPGDSVPIGIVNAMVAGTFLYVSIVEIAVKEIMTHRGSDSGSCGSDGSSAVSVEIWQIRKLIAFLIGYTSMSMLAIWV